MKPEQESLKTLISETVTLLCKNRLQFSKELKIQGLLGITIDENEIFLIQIDEKTGSVLANITNNNDGNIALVGSSCSQKTTKQTNPVGISTNRFPTSRFPQRPMRPLSRFGHQSAQRFSKRARTSVPTSVPLSSFNTSSPYSGSTTAEQQGDNFSRNEADGKRTQVKTEDDPDLIIIDHDGDGDVKQTTQITDDRQAMLGSYVMEASDNETNLAQNIFSEFSLITSTNAGGGLGALGRNYGNQTSGDMDMSMSFNTLNTSAPIGSVSWDSAALSGLSSSAGASTSSMRSVNMPVRATFPNFLN